MTDPDVAAGLCASCRWTRLVEGRRSTFYLCARSRFDPRFPRYPPLPVHRCEGYEPRAPGEPPARDDPDA